MGTLNGLKNVVGFLTILPVGMDANALITVARNIYLFPPVGALMGFLAGGLGWLGLHALPPLVTGMVVLGFISLLSGFNHIDGLLDFGDGIMTVGPPEKKIEAMHDKRVGAGGISLGLIVFLTTAFCIAEIGLGYIIPALIAVETSAKFSMIVIAKAGRSGHEGLNRCFVNVMHGPNGNHLFLISLVISLVLVSIFWKIMGAIVVTVGTVTSLLMTAIAHRHFDGVTGDVFGAANEISRATCLIATLGMIRWV